MGTQLEKVCIGHINYRGEDCKGCKIDEGNKQCPNYLSQKDAIKLYRPEEIPSRNSPVGVYAQ